jgi:hypothetical protein
LDTKIKAKSQESSGKSVIENARKYIGPGFATELASKIGRAGQTGLGIGESVKGFSTFEISSSPHKIPQEAEKAQQRSLEALQQIKKLNDQRRHLPLEQGYKLDASSNQADIPNATPSDSSKQSNLQDIQRNSHAHDRSKVSDASSQQDISDILKKAEPQLSSEAISALEVMKKYLGDGENKPSKDEYINSFKKVLRIVSPETMKEYEDLHIEFVVNDGVNYLSARETKPDKWKVNLPSKYEYPVQCTILHCLDDLLRIRAEKVECFAKKVSNLHKIDTIKKANEWADSYIEASRIEFASRAFHANMMLGEKYGWKIEKYPLAEQFQKDYYEGIHKAFEDGKINNPSSKEALEQIGKKYARIKLHDSITPPEGIPKIFLPMQPGSYFEEFNIPERVKRRNKPGKPDIRFLAMEPAKLGSPEFHTLMKNINSRGKEEDTTLNAVILWDKTREETTIWVLPCYFQEGQRSQHSIAAKGNCCVWAGEIIIDGNKVTKICDKSGHFRTFSYDEKVQKAINDFALQAFRNQGYDVPSVVELTRNTQ